MYFLNSVVAWQFPLIIMIFCETLQDKAWKGLCLGLITEMQIAFMAVSKHSNDPSLHEVVKSFVNYRLPVEIFVSGHLIQGTAGRARSTVQRDAVQRWRRMLVWWGFLLTG